MKVLTIKSSDMLEDALQTDVHYTFGMEHYTDYVFKPRGDQKYSATIVMEDTSVVITNVITKSKCYPTREFLIDDLDMERNTVERYRVKNGKVIGQLQRGWEWGKE